MDAEAYGPQGHSRSRAAYFAEIAALPEDDKDIAGRSLDMSVFLNNNWMRCRCLLQQFVDLKES